MNGEVWVGTSIDSRTIRWVIGVANCVYVVTFVVVKIAVVVFVAVVYLQWMLMMLLLL